MDLRERAKSFFGIGWTQILYFIFILLVVGATFLEKDRGRLAQFLARRAEYSFFVLLIILSLFCLWRAWRFYRYEGSLDGSITGVFAALIVASFVSDYNPRQVARLLGERVSFAEEIFSILITGVIVYIAFLVIVDAYNRTRKG